jgi:ribosomal protein S18 acetylase RimI-like enzyme
MVKNSFDNLRLRYKNLIILNRDLHEDIKDTHPKIKDPITRLIAREEAYHLKSYDGTWHPKWSIFDLYERGYELFATSVGGGDASYLWIEYKTAYWTYIKPPFSLPTNTSRISNAYTKPDFRCLGLSKYTYNHALNYLKNKGFECAFLEIEVNNIPSLKSVKEVGFKPYLWVKYFQIGVLTFYWLHDGRRTGLYLSLWNKVPRKVNDRFYPTTDVKMGTISNQQEGIIKNSNSY